MLNNLPGGAWLALMIAPLAMGITSFIAMRKLMLSLSLAFATALLVIVVSDIPFIITIPLMAPMLLGAFYALKLQRGTL